MRVYKLMNYRAWACREDFIHQNPTPKVYKDHIFDECDHTGHPIQTRFFAGQIMHMLEPNTPPGGTKYWKRLNAAFGCSELVKGEKPVKKVKRTLRHEKNA